MINSENILQSANSLASIETTVPLQPQDLDNLIKAQLTKLDKHMPGYAAKIEKLYYISNLSEEIKNKVIDKYRDINIEHDWYSYVCNDWVEKLKNYGFNSIKINFSGFGSQGDGASFTADVDLEMYLKSHELSEKYDKAFIAASEHLVKVEIYRTCYQYSHENTVSVRTEYFGVDNHTEVQIDELIQLVLKRVQCLSKEIYESLENDYIYLTSDATVLDTLEANNCLFKSNGEFFGSY